ncbi:MAG: hypothetical protein JJU42_00225 [Rhodobacteraceae bacterium]|nr:hypothetical protein [Paracoccaceae bacterium]
MSQTLYIRLVRAACYVPPIGRGLHALIVWLMVHLPGIDTLTRWRIIGRSTWKAELTRRQRLREGSVPTETGASRIVVETSALAAIVRALRPGGTFDALESKGGIFIAGAVKSGNTPSVTVHIDDIPVCKRNLPGRQTKFDALLGHELVRSFPTECGLSIVDDTGARLSHGGADAIRVRIPNASGELAGLAAKGNLLTKKGELAQANPNAVAKRQQEYLDAYVDIAARFEAATGKPLFVSYGTLLGCIREGGVIENDDDFDVSYLSDLETPEEVRKEALEFAKRLEAWPLVTQVRRDLSVHRQGEDVIISLGVPLWFHGDDLIMYTGKKVRCTRDDILPARQVMMAGVPVLVPNNAERILEGYYGKTWRTPDPGYISDMRTRDRASNQLWRRTLFTPKDVRRMGLEIGLEEGADSR